MKITRLHLAALSLGLAIIGTMALPNQANAQRGQGGGGQGRGPGGFGGFGQGRGGGMFGNQDPTTNMTTMLIQRDDVQAELGIGGAQKEKIQAAQQTTRQAMQKVMQDSGIDFQAMRDPNLDPAKRQEMMAQMREKMTQMREKMQTAQKTANADAQKEIEAALTPAQRKRLAELELQYRGPIALADETVAKQFNVTPDQQREIGNILTEYKTGQAKVQEEMRSKMPQPGGGGGQGFDRQAFQTAMEESRKSTDRIKKASEDKIVALLSASQKSAWTAAKGKAFTFKDQQGGPNGGGGRGQGRGGAPAAPPM